MSLQQIQEWATHKTVIYTALASGWAGSFADLWIDAAGDYLLFGTRVVLFLYPLSMLIINLPKVMKVLAAPFRKDPEEEN